MEQGKAKGRIPRSFIDDLIARVDIVPIVDARVKLKKTGKNYSACCPFHDEKTPSFTVSPDKQFYYCFGCGASGNAVGFLMEYERRGFIEAVEDLASYAGVEVVREQGVPNSERDRELAELRDLMSFALDFYSDRLLKTQGREPYARYLASRGLDGDTVKRYGLGAAHPGWERLLDACKSRFKKDILARSGLFVDNPDKERSYDRFRNRVLFPIRDVRGRTIGFGGRTLGDDKPKYLNSPETEIFSKGKTLYGLYEVRQSAKKLESLIVTEGYMDVIALAQHGVDNAVATLGTACTADHLNLAFRYVDRIIFCFDGDTAGRTAARRAMENALPALEDGKQLRFLFLPEGHDPDTLVRQVGKERFLARLDSAVPFEDFLFQSLEETIDTSTLDGRVRLAKAAAPYLHQIPTGLYRELMFTSLANRTGVERALLDEQIKTVVQAPSRRYSEDNIPRQPLHPQPIDDLSAQPPGLSGHRFEEAGSAQGPTFEAGDQQDYDYPEILGFMPDLEQSSSSQADDLLPDTATIFNNINTCIIFLLNEPSLIKRTDRELEVPGGREGIDDDEEAPSTRTSVRRHPLTALSRLMAYLRRETRPQTLPSILGYWASQYGLEAQAQLAELSDRYLTLHGSYHASFNTEAQFADAIERLYQLQERAKVLRRIKVLEGKGFTAWTKDEKTEYLALNRSPFIVNHFKPLRSDKFQ